MFGHADLFSWCDGSDLRVLSDKTHSNSLEPSWDVPASTWSVVALVVYSPCDPNARFVARA